MNGSSTEAGLYANGTYSGGYFGSVQIFIWMQAVRILYKELQREILYRKRDTGVGQLSYAAGNVGIGTANTSE